MVGERFARLAAKGTLAAAKGIPEYLVAIAPEHILTRKTGDLFRRAVKKQDTAVPVVGDYALHQVIQYMLQILLLGNEIFEVNSGHEIQSDLLSECGTG
jgi:hypothetical protein